MNTLSWDLVNEKKLISKMFCALLKFGNTVVLLKLLSSQSCSLKVSARNFIRSCQTTIRPLPH